MTKAYLSLSRPADRKCRQWRRGGGSGGRTTCTPCKRPETLCFTVARQRRFGCGGGGSDDDGDDDDGSGPVDDLAAAAFRRDTHYNIAYYFHTLYRFSRGGGGGRGRTGHPGDGFCAMDTYNIVIATRREKKKNDENSDRGEEDIRRRGECLSDLRLTTIILLYY